MKTKTKPLYDTIKTGDIIRIGTKRYTLEVADTFMSRFLGLMGRKSLPSDRALFIKPCNSIHTFFMRFRMTAVFVDKDMRVVRVVPNMAPWRMAFAPKAYSVFELAGDEGEDIKEGEVLNELFRILGSTPLSKKKDLAPVSQPATNP